MKITIVLGPFQALPPQGHGAVEKVWHALALEFAQLHHEVVLIGKCASTGEKPPSEFGIRIVPLRGFTATGHLWADLMLDLGYALQVRRRIEPSEIVVTNSFWTPVLLSLSQKRPGKIVVHIARFPKGQMGLYRSADALQAVSSAVAKEIVRQNPNLAKNVHVLPYPVDLHTYHPPTVARRYDGDLILLYVGRVHPEKGLDLLISALRRLVTQVPRVRLRVVGPAAVEQGGGGTAFLNSLKSAADGLPVDFVGPISEPAALALEYQRAHCFCYPSLAERGEAMGLAALEAMATALPVVVSDLACFRDFIVPGRDGLIFDHRAPAPESALKIPLRQILTEPEFALRLGQNAADRAQDFELKKIARRYIGFFEAVARN